MFEFHCWAVVRDGDTASSDALLDRVQARIAALPESLQDAFHVGTINPCSVTASGVRNHHAYEVLDVFHWLASQSANVYGILFFQDDGDADGTDRFTVRRIRGGRVEPVDDPFLA